MVKLGTVLPENTATCAKLAPRNEEYICLKECTRVSAYHTAQTDSVRVITDLLSIVVPLAALFHGRGNGCTEILGGS